MSLFREDLTELLPQLRAYARSLTRGDMSLADDLVQDAVVNALRAEHQYTPGTNLKAWLFTILRNRFLSSSNRKYHHAEQGDLDLDSLASVPATQDSAIEVHEFRRAFRKLSAAHREILVLTILHGLPYQDVGVMLGCEVGTVKSRVNRARAQLKRMLMGDEPEMVEAARPQRSEDRPRRTQVERTLTL
jgi:RNA polymerase sigma-70 factor (ECF subfamily)